MNTSKIIGIILFLCGTATNLHAQTEIKGQVIDNTGSIPDALVSLNEQKVKTGLDGAFNFQVKTTGTYILKITTSEYSEFIDTLEIKTLKPLNLGKINIEKGSKQAQIEEVVINHKMEEGNGKANVLQKNENTIGNIEYVGDGEQVAYNAADNLQKMPAVTIQKDQGEGRYMSVRGTPTNWNSSLINGDRLPVADENSETRTMAFDVISSDLLEYIKVAKAITPDMEGDAIGGSVNFITKTAPDSSILRINLMGGYGSQAQKPIYNGNILYGLRTKNKKFGMLFNFSSYVRNWGTDNFEVVYGSNYNHGLNRLELRDYKGLRTTLSGNLALDYRFNNKGSIYLKGLIGSFTDNEYNMKTRYNYAIGAGSTIMLQHIHSISSSLLYGGELGINLPLGKKVTFNAKASTYSNQYGFKNIPYKGKDSRNGYMVVNFEKFNVHFKDQIYVDKYGNSYRQDQNGNPIDANGGTINDPSLELMRVKLIGKDNPFGDGDSWNNIQPIIQGSNSAGDYEFSGAYTELNNTWEKDPLIASSDISIAVNKNLNLKFGGKFRYKDGYRSLSLINYWQNFNTFSNPIKLVSFPHSDLNLNGGFLQELGQPYKGTFMPFMNQDLIDQFVQNMGDTLRTEPMTPAHHNYYEFIGSTYSYQEYAEAAFGMAEWNISPKFTLIGGLRIEATQLTMEADSVLNGPNDWFLANIYNVPDKGYEVVPIDNDPYQNSGYELISQYTVAYPVVKSKLKNSYISPLPMLHLRYDPDKNTVVRFALTRTYRRPNFIETKPGSPIIDYTNLEFNRGNPNLKPSYAWNMDLSYEYYMKDASLFTVGLFGKRITDHIYRTITADIDPQLGIIYKSYLNATSPIYLSGIEINIKKKFSFLPGILKNFGVDGNFTYSYSRMQIPGRSFKQALPMQPPKLFNAALFYEGKRGLKARMALNYTDGYLMEVNTAAVTDNSGQIRLLHDNTDYDVFLRYKWSLDFSLSYTINKHIAIYTELANILNQPFYVYRGQEWRPMQVEYYSLKSTLGIKLNF